MKLTTQRLKKLIQEELNEMDHVKEQEESSKYTRIHAQMDFLKATSALNRLANHFRFDSEDKEKTELANKIVKIERDLNALYTKEFVYKDNSEQ